MFSKRRRRRAPASSSKNANNNTRYINMMMMENKIENTEYSYIAYYTRRKHDNDTTPFAHYTRMFGRGGEASNIRLIIVGVGGHIVVRGTTSRYCALPTLGERPPPRERRVCDPVVGFRLQLSVLTREINSDRLTYIYTSPSKRLLQRIYII